MNNPTIDGGKEFDWGKASRDYARYRDIYPTEFYDRILSKGLCVKGQKILDIGTGTGVIPRHMAKYGGEFVGVDISENQIKYAEKLSRDAGLDIRYIVCPAERLELPEQSFDVVTACQCLYYFDHEILFPKIHSLLKQKGRFLILFMEWLYFESDTVRTSIDLIKKYNPSWAGSEHTDVVYPVSSAAEGLFSVVSNETYRVDLTFTRESWNGRMKCCRGVGAEMPPEKVELWEKKHKKYLDTLPEKFVIPHHIIMTDLKKI